MGSKIEKLKNIIVSLKKAVLAEVGKVVERMEVVVVSEPRVVVGVQETKVWRVVEKRVQVQVLQQLQALIAKLVGCFVKGQHQDWRTAL